MNRNFYPTHDMYMSSTVGGAEVSQSPCLNSPTSRASTEKVGRHLTVLNAMSFLVPARQSASRSAILQALRHASSSANAPTKVASSSVQRVDEQLALRQKQQAALRRSGRQMDIMSASIQVLGMSVEEGSRGAYRRIDC